MSLLLGRVKFGVCIFKGDMGCGVIYEIYVVCKCSQKTEALGLCGMLMRTRREVKDT